MYKYYIEIDNNNYITKAFSSAFTKPTAQSICVNKHGSRQFHLDLRNEHGLCKQWINGKIADAKTSIATIQQNTILAIKAQAAKRILAEYPLWKQQNITRAAVLNNNAKSIAANKACEAYITNIRRLSNNLEAKVNKMNMDDLTSFNPNEDTLWK